MSAGVGSMLARCGAKLMLIGLALAAQAAEPIQSGAQIAIIIDDVGYNLALGRRAAELPGAYTLALLPDTPHSQSLAEYGQKHGKELMLHLPMASERGLPLGPGGLEVDMPRRPLLHSLRASLDSLPAIVGVNNHMGSALTVRARPMGWVMGELRRRGLFFIDSRTTAASVAKQVAQHYGVKAIQRDVFLDHQRDTGHIRQQLLHALQLAQQRGSAVAIAHPYPETLALLEQAEAMFDGAAVQLVSASALVRRPPVYRGYCPSPPRYLRAYYPPSDAVKPLVANGHWWNWKSLID